MTEPERIERVELTEAQLLCVEDVTVQAAPQVLADRVLPPGAEDTPLFMVSCKGLRPVGAGVRDQTGLVADPQALGHLVGLVETRLAQVAPEYVARFTAARDQASGIARATAVYSHTTMVYPQWGEVRPTGEAVKIDLAPDDWIADPLGTRLRMIVSPVALRRSVEGTAQVAGLRWLADTAPPVRCTAIVDVAALPATIRVEDPPEERAS